MDPEFMWFCGFMEGEGSFISGSDKNGYKFARITVQSTDLDIIKRANKFMNDPNIKIKKELNRKDAYIINMTSKEPVAQMAERMYPHMGIRRKEQAFAAMLYATEVGKRVLNRE